MKSIFPVPEESALKDAFFAGRVGYFVEVGANFPKIDSQTWSLEESGWDGVLVEPQPALAADLRAQRKAKVYQVACSSPANAGKTMELSMAGAHSSLERMHYVAGSITSPTIDVPIMTLDSILEDAVAPVPLDFLSIDVESHEIAVLDGLNLEKWKPRLILIEDLVLDLRLHRYLTGRGYRWVRRTHLNGWYVPQSSAMRVSVYGWLQFIRKYYLGVPFRRLREAKRKWLRQ